MRENKGNAKEKMYKLYNKSSGGMTSVESKSAVRSYIESNIPVISDCNTVEIYVLLSG